MDYQEFYEKFMTHFEKEDKENSVNTVMQIVSGREIDIIDLYTKILTPALYSIAGDNLEQKITISQEHIRTSIIRTIIECCYPYVVVERNLNYTIKKENRKKVIILCPEDEYHEIGPRMVEDFFTLNHYEPIFLGGNTPREDLMTLIEEIKPEYIAVSVANYYNIVTAKKMVEKMKAQLSYTPKVIAGGYAIRKKKESKNELGVDYILDTFEDIQTLAREDYGDVFS